jgi:hypothetical protein
VVSGSQQTYRGEEGQGLHRARGGAFAKEEGNRAVAVSNPRAAPAARSDGPDR